MAGTEDPGAQVALEFRQSTWAGRSTTTFPQAVRRLVAAVPFLQLEVALTRGRWVRAHWLHAHQAIACSSIMLDVKRGVPLSLRRTCKRGACRPSPGIHPARCAKQQRKRGPANSIHAPAPHCSSTSRHWTHGGAAQEVAALWPCSGTHAHHWTHLQHRLSGLMCASLNLLEAPHSAPRSSVRTALLAAQASTTNGTSSL